MSDIDTTYDNGDNGYDASHVDAGQENYDLDHANQVHADQHDASQNYNAYGEEHNYEKDLDYDNGKHVEYHSPDGASYSSTEFTHLDTHVEDHEAAYAENYSAHEHDASYDSFEHLREQFAAEFLHADYAHEGGYEGGQQELSAVNK